MKQHPLNQKKIPYNKSIIIACLIMFTITLQTFHLLAQPAFDWAKQIGGTTNVDDGWAMAIDSAGNVYTTGFFTGDVDFNPSDTAEYLLTTNGNEAAYVCKLDSSGHFVWAKQMLGISGFAYSLGRSITVDKHGNVYSTGYFGGTVDFDPDTSKSLLQSSGNSDVYVSKLNAAGNFVWAKSWGGFFYGDVSNGIAVDNDENVFTTGNFGGTVDFDPGSAVFELTSPFSSNNDIFISKLNAFGNFVWAKQLNSTGFKSAGYSIALDDSANVYSTGNFDETIDMDPGTGTHLLKASMYNNIYIGANDIYVSKLDSSGKFVWGEQMGGIQDDLSNYIALDSLGNVYTTGAFNDTADFNPSPFLTHNLISAGSSDIFTSKLDRNGHFLWAKHSGGPGEDLAHGLSIDYKGNVYTIGAITDKIDADPGLGIYNLTSAGAFDVFFSKLNTDGHFIYAALLGGKYGDFGHAIIVNKQEEIYFTGHFNDLGPFGGEADFDPSTLEYLLIANKGRDIFSSKLSKGICPLPEKPLITSSGFLPFCSNDGVVLLTDSSYATYKWLPTGSTTKNIKINTSGTYSVIIGNACGKDTSLAFDIIVNPSPTVTATPTPIGICSGDSVSITASAQGGGANTYFWSPALGLNATTGNTITTKTPVSTSYTLTGISSLGCKDTSLVKVTVYPSPQITLSPPVTILFGESTVLTASANGVGGTAYQWMPVSEELSCATCPNPSASPTLTTNYILTVRDYKNCLTTDSVRVVVIIPPVVLLPNVFTPNGDGNNDTFEMLRPNNGFSVFSLVIFDRWGLQINEIANGLKGWDGTNKAGHEVPAGVYFYVLKAGILDLKQYSQKGSITLVRPE